LNPNESRQTSVTAEVFSRVLDVPKMRKPAFVWRADLLVLYFKFISFTEIVCQLVTINVLNFYVLTFSSGNFTINSVLPGSEVKPMCPP